MQTRTEIGQLLGEMIRRRREEALSGKRQPHSFVESAVSSAITRAARAYMDGISFCPVIYPTHYNAQRSERVVDEIRQKLYDLFGDENVKVDLEPDSSIYIFIGFPRTR